MDRLLFAGNSCIQMRADSITGITDLYPQASLSWNKGNDNCMTYITGNVPIGTYNPMTLSSLGIGHAAVEVGGEYSYLNNATGLEYSGALGATYNFVNNQTNCENGIDSHFDWDISHFLSEHWQVGIAGYVYCQLTADSGSGDRGALNPVWLLLGRKSVMNLT